MKSRTKICLTISLCVFTLAVVVATSSQAAAQSEDRQQDREFVYTANFADRTVSGFSLNPANGKMTEVPGSPFGSGVGPFSMAHSPDGRFLYVVIVGQFIGGPCGSNNGELISYSVNPRTGSLTLIDDQMLSGVCAGGIAIDPSGEFVYAASFPGDAPAKVGLIDGYRTSNGHLIPLPGTPFASPIGVSPGQQPAIAGMVISHDGKVLYAADPNDSAGVLIFDRNRKTGVLTFRTAFNSGSNFFSLAISPSGDFLLGQSSLNLAVESTNQIFEFKIGAHGNLTPVKGSPFTVPSVALDVVISPNGEFVASPGAGVNMQRSNQHGRLTVVPGSPFPAPPSFVINFDPSGHFVIASGAVFKVHPETGALTQVSTFTPGGFVDGIDALRPCKIRDRGNDSDDKDNAGRKQHDDDKHEAECPDQDNKHRDRD